MPSTTEISGRVEPIVPSCEPDASFDSIASLRIRGFRSVVDATLAPGQLCALIGDAQVGKSNLLAAIEVLLDESAVVTSSDESALAEQPISIEATFETGGG